MEVRAAAVPAPTVIHLHLPSNTPHNPFNSSKNLSILPLLHEHGQTLLPLSKSPQQSQQQPNNPQQPHPYPQS
ncbi:hypothetical protein PILCRDRAFT_9773 [Piloderma croceum F 1598]|uniref:Uncharacterized protein n=1 Tax=Piloderma croceum (strain F 1598) TaxID=765440 RepID=A0A0C3FL20_PILCF|nr:hypothetical protein PILCRDRAFT_9773 [Piloderma croceum F 1598]